jgi:hypothetical protein
MSENKNNGSTGNIAPYIQTEKNNEWSYVFTKKFPSVKKIEFHNQMVTVVYWDDNTVTRVKIGKNDVFSEEYGLAMAVAKKMYGSYDRFVWSLSKAKRYENGKRVKK